ncbi:hypothetical protein Pan216_57190 [Planctomycetes bacterium Pan216]|uniref:Outer membrane protein beta-barrel domain-containing protein n=1 Tax=Kolteria novifilia TaxID=2527975 RepID=A0A518BCW9_9BACT|nr:hypothetical protein Pan216_57190 [Planctomycetes bacterium Pan216]
MNVRAGAICLSVTLGLMLPRLAWAAGPFVTQGGYSNQPIEVVDDADLVPAPIRTPTSRAPRVTHPAPIPSSTMPSESLREPSLPSSMELPPGHEPMEWTPHTWEESLPMEEPAPIESVMAAPCGCVKGCGCIAAYADLLIMRPTVGNLNFVIDGDLVGTPPQSPVGSVESLQLDWDLGVRGGLAFEAKSGWDIDFNYTYLHTNDSRTVAPSNGRVILPRDANQSLTFAEADQASASAGFDYDVYALSFGKWFDPAPGLSLRFSAGPRFVSVDLGMNVDASPIYVDPFLVAQQSRVRVTNQFSGTGLVADGELHWVLGRVVSVFGRFGGGVFYGQYRNDFSEHWDNHTIYDLTRRVNRSIPMIEAAMGISLRHGHWELIGGYEVVSWIDLFERSDADTLLTSTSNLGLDGAFLRLMFVY